MHGGLRLRINSQPGAWANVEWRGGGVFRDSEKTTKGELRQRIWEIVPPRVEVVGSAQSGHRHLQCKSFDYLAMRKKGEAALFI